jgi:membrane fusion protein (multidrug efflux system)
MKPGRILIILSSLFVIVVIYLNKCNNSESATPTSGKPGASGAMAVNGFVVKSSTVSESIHVTGTILSNKEVEIRNEIAGKLVKIYFEEGSKVRQGDLLVKIYDEDLQAELKKLQLELQLAKLSEKRLADLLKVEGISQQDYDEALNSVQRIEADMNLVKVQISKTEIRAPFNGLAGLEMINEGSVLPMNSKIVTLQNIDPVKLEFSVPEKYKSMIMLNQLVNFTLISARGEFQAKIYAIEPKIDPLTRSVLIRAYCSNPDGLLTPGAFASIDVPLKKLDSALMIPSQAVIPELKGYKLFVQQNGKASPRKVDIGIRNDSTVQIISGLHDGDTVLTNGIMQLRPEMPVSVTIN